MLSNSITSSRALSRLNQNKIETMEGLFDLSKDDARLREILCFNPEAGTDRSGYANVVKAINEWIHPTTTTDSTGSVTSVTELDLSTVEFANQIPGRAVVKLANAGILTTEELVTTDENRIKEILCYDPLKADRVGFTSTMKFIQSILNPEVETLSNKDTEATVISGTSDSCVPRSSTREIPEGFTFALNRLGMTVRSRSGRVITLDDALTNGQIRYNLVRKLESGEEYRLSGQISPYEFVRM